MCFQMLFCEKDCSESDFLFVLSGVELAKNNKV